MTSMSSTTPESRPVRGRPFLGAFFGLLLGVFGTFDLLQMGVIPLESVLVLALPVGGLVLGAVLGMIAPLRFLRR
jgi:hypothetical protein